MDSLIEQTRARILEVAAKHGAGNVRLFGSRARGDARPDSDADFLIDIVGPTSPWFPGGLIVELKELLGCEVDVGMPQELDPIVRDRVLAEAVPL